MREREGERSQKNLGKDGKTYKHPMKFIHYDPSLWIWKVFSNTSGATLENEALVRL